MSSTALTPYEASSFNEALTISKTFYDSGMFPKLRSPEQVFAIIAAGRELGMPAMQSLRSLHFYEGRISLSSDLIVALIKRSASCKYLKLVEYTDKACEMETLRDGDPGPTRMRWTIEDAMKAGLTGKDNWKKYPRDMLRARCGASICRAVYPELAMGLYDSDSGELDAGRVPAEVAVVVPQAVAAPVAPVAVPDAVFEPVTDELSIEETLTLSLIKNDLVRAQTQADCDTLSARYAGEVEGPALSRCVAMFQARRGEIGHGK